MPDFVLTIDVKNVAKGDVRGLVDRIMERHGEDFDAERGDFAIRVSERHGDAFFPVDLEEEDE